MKKTILFSVITLLFVSVTTQAQFSRNSLRERAERLVSSSADLASRLNEELRRSFTSNGRSELEAAFLASQLESSARLFEQMVRDNRRDSELREAVSIISDLVRRAPSFGSQSYYWSDVKRAFEEVQRDVGGIGSGNNGNNGNNNDNRPVIGRVRWRGTVDDEVQLVIRGNSIEVRTISGSAYNNGNYNFTSNLPNRRVEVFADKKKGRGNVEVIQQPNRANDFTTVIQIRDKDGGARDYEVEIFWREGGR